MRKPKEFDSYISDVCAQIRTQQVHEEVGKELLCHMEEQRQAYMESGMDAAAAAQKTVQDMGDPVLTGGQLDRAHRPRANGRLLFFTGLMVLIAAAMQVLLVNTPGYWVALAVGLALCVGMYFVDYTVFARYAWALLGVAAALLAVVMVVGMQEMEYGVYLHGRVSAFVFLFVPIYCGIIYNLKGKRYAGLGIALGIMLAPVLYLCLVPRVGMALVLGIACYTLLLMAVAAGWFGGSKPVGIALLVLVPAICVAIVILLGENYQLTRLATLVGVGKHESFMQHEMRGMLAGAQSFGVSTTMNETFQIGHGFAVELGLLYVVGHYGIVPAVGMVAAMASMPFLFGSNAMVVVNMMVVGIFLSACKWNGVVSEKALFRKKAAKAAST